MDGIGTEKKILWGVYPSSASANDDDEVLSDFTHRLRTTVSRVHFAERGQPLFVRHTAAIKRSAAKNIDRTDPTNQIQTLHINPHYNGRIAGKHIVVVDDCTTYGVSFGVAAAFLRKAGAAKVTGIALGKFGSQLRHYDIDIAGSPYQPVTSGFSYNSSTIFSGSSSQQVQQTLHLLMP